MKQRRVSSTNNSNDNNDNGSSHSLPTHYRRRYKKKRPSSVWLCKCWCCSKPKTTTTARYTKQQQQRTRNTYGVCGLLFVLLLLLSVLLPLVLHRLLAWYMSTVPWDNAPISTIHRQCPQPSYPTLLSSTSTTQEQQTQPNICITTLTDQVSKSRLQSWLRWRNFDGILELTWPNKVQYAAQYNNYQLYNASDCCLHTSRPPAWSKIQAVLYVMEQTRTTSAHSDESYTNNNHHHHHNPENERRHSEHYACDWIVWTDADTVIMNPTIRIESFLPSDPTVDLVIASDKGGGYNSGVFFLRNTPWSRTFLSKWWNMTSFIKVHGLAKSGDNDALKELLLPHNTLDFDKKVRVPPRCTFNSFALFFKAGNSVLVEKDNKQLEQYEWFMDTEHYHQGDFIAHTPGKDNKAHCLKLLLQLAAKPVLPSLET